MCNLRFPCGDYDLLSPRTQVIRRIWCGDCPGYSLQEGNAGRSPSAGTIQAHTHHAHDRSTAAAPRQCMSRSGYAWRFPDGVSTQCSPIPPDLPPCLWPLALPAGGRCRACGHARTAPDRREAQHRGTSPHEARCGSVGLRRRHSRRIFTFVKESVLPTPGQRGLVLPGRRTDEQVLQIAISANGGHNFRQCRDLNAFTRPCADACQSYGAPP